MQKSSRIRKGDTAEIRQAKRALKRRLRVKFGHSTRKQRQAILQQNITSFSPQNSLNKGRSYAKMVEHFCVVNKMGQWNKARQRSISLSADFSLYQDPDKVLKCLLHLLYDAKKFKEYPTLRYRGKVCFGALYLLDNMCWEIAQHRGWQLKLADMPTIEQEKLAKLRSFETGAYKSSSAYMLNEAVYINRKAGLSAQTYKRKSAELRQLIEDAVSETTGQPYHLSQDANTAIYSAIGEQFDNVLEHVPDAETAQLCCFYDRTIKELTILIYNFGPTIAENIKSSRLPPQVSGPVRDLIAHHTKNYWFVLAKPGRAFTEENALTLLALQEGISSRLEYDETRGFGLLDFIEYCFALTSKARIAIISGTTAISIDNTYPIGRRHVFGRERRILALNLSNNLMVRPDSEKIRTLSVKFLGVIIETTIPLDV